MIRRTPIRRCSTKRAAQLRIYTKKRIAFLEANPVCQVCGNARAGEVHHAWGRIGELLNAEEHWLAVCRWCHNEIHNKPKWARANGYLL
jgi:hypothetical protein